LHFRRGVGASFRPIEYRGQNMVREVTFSMAFSLPKHREADDRVQSAMIANDARVTAPNRWLKAGSSLSLRRFPDDTFRPGVIDLGGGASRGSEADKQLPSLGTWAT